MKHYRTIDIFEILKIVNVSEFNPVSCLYNLTPTGSRARCVGVCLKRWERGRDGWGDAGTFLLFSEATIQPHPPFFGCIIISLKTEIAIQRPHAESYLT